VYQLVEFLQGTDCEPSIFRPLLIKRVIRNNVVIAVEVFDLKIRRASFGTR